MPLPDFPRVPLAHLPTPLEPLDRLRAHLARELGGCPRLFIKRDDCTGLALGGNKTRKLEYLIGAALAEGATSVVSEGGLQSNHVRQTAAAAARHGLKCHLVLNHNVPIDTAIYRESGNIFLDRLLGATIHRCAPDEARADAIQRLLPQLSAAGETPYYIPTGGSNAVGSLGYIDAALELQQQAKEAGIALDRVLFASASGGTHAGLIVGMALAGSRTEVLGVDVEGDPETLLAEVRAVADECAEMVRLKQPLGSEAFRLARGYAGEGYGIPSAGMREAVTLLARLEGIILDPVYVGKAMAGLIGMIRAREIAASDTIAFIHTGGMPAMFAYADSF